MREILRSSAYGGPGWRPRAGTLEKEQGTWSGYRVDSESGRLQAVLLYKPGRELAGLGDPNMVQHLAKIDPARIAREFDALSSLYRSFGVHVHLIDRRSFGCSVAHSNLMYARDLFFSTRSGAVVARMGSAVRAGEEKYAALALARVAVPIGQTISGRGTFEGADALWLDSKTVLCGIGTRTNPKGFRQLAGFLAFQGVRCLHVRLPPGVQHLLGILQLVDRDLALVRVEKCSDKLLSILARRGIKVVPVSESHEALARQGMNVVTIAPRTIIMPTRCPELRKLYRRSGVEVAAEIRIDQLARGAGGLACATGILSRASVSAEHDQE